MSTFDRIRPSPAPDDQSKVSTPIGMSTERRQQVWGWVFLSPWILGFLVFTLVPMVASLIFSFTNFRLSEPDNIQFIGLQNWQRLFNDPVLHTSIMVTLKFAVIALPLAIVLPVALATLLNAPYLKGKPFFRTLFYMPYMVPVVSAVYIWNGVLGTDTGWVNRLLGVFGIPGPNWMFSQVWIYPALTLVGLWGIGNAMLITLSSMIGVPTELYEAARVDGANGWTRFRKITLPLISPVVFYNLVLSVIGLFRYFEIPYVLKKGTGDPGNATMFINIHFYKTALAVEQNMGYGATLAWVIFAMAFAATLFIFATARYWVYYPSSENGSW